MGKTKIEWTSRRIDWGEGRGRTIQGYTFNPWIGCVKISPGCKHCYAEALSNRFYPGAWGANSPRHFTGDTYWGFLGILERKAKKLGANLRVFVGSMSDIMEDREDLDAARDRLWAAILDCPNLDFLLLTKRPENYRTKLPRDWVDGQIPPNVWLGTSIESKNQIGRAYELNNLPAFVRFVSAEPLLGPVDLRPYLGQQGGINWLIIGGESGHGARPMHPKWAGDLIAQGSDAGIPVFFKQWGAYAPAQASQATIALAYTGKSWGAGDLYFPIAVTRGDVAPMAKGSKKANGRTFEFGKRYEAAPPSYNDWGQAGDMEEK